MAFLLFLFLLLSIDNVASSLLCPAPKLYQANKYIAFNLKRQCGMSRNLLLMSRMLPAFH